MGEIIIGTKQKLVTKESGAGGALGSGGASKRHPYLKEMVLVLAALTTNNVFYIAFSLFIPNLFLDYVATNYPQDTSQEMDSRASSLKSISDSLPFISMFLLGPLFGALSDKYGRKKMFYLLLFISGLDITSSLVSYQTGNMYFYYVIHAFCGITESFNSIAYSYISDITCKEERSKYYTLTGITWGLGVLIGIVITVTIVKINLIYALVVSYAFLIVTVVIVFFMRESIGLINHDQEFSYDIITTSINISAPPSPRKQIPSVTLNPLKLIKLLVVENGGYVTWATLLYFIVSYTSEDVFVTSFIYTKLRYNWGTTQNGIYSGVAGICILGWSTLCPLLLRHFSERALFSVMVLYGGLMHVLFAFSVNQWMWMITASVGAVALIELSLVVSIISKAVPPELQGSVLNSVAAVSSVASFLGAAANQSIFAYFISNGSPVYFPGAQFMINAIVLVLTFFLSLFIWRKYKVIQFNPKLIKDDAVPDEEGGLSDEEAHEKQSLIVKKDKLINRLSKIFKKNNKNDQL